MPERATRATSSVEVSSLANQSTALHFYLFIYLFFIKYNKIKVNYTHKVLLDVQINDSSDNQVIVDSFVTHFASTYTDTYTDNASQLEFAQDYNSSAYNDPCDLSQFSVEIIDA